MVVCPKRALLLFAGTWFDGLGANPRTGPSRWRVISTGTIVMPQARFEEQIVHDILDVPVSQIVDGTVAVAKNVPDRKSD